MKKSLNLLLALFLLASTTMMAQQAKYVFYFIGDGMGLNQVNGTEMYLGELEGKIGISPLCFANFPVTGVATSFSAANSVTDSAAAGTALATGKKTKNGAIGVTADNEPATSVATWAKTAGRKVGVATSVSIDHATPASFYAHRPDRRMYYEIATDLPKAGFDFYAGSGFLQPSDPETPNKENIYNLFDRTGYTLARGYAEFNEKYQKASKMILLQDVRRGRNSLPYAIDREEGDLTLTQITQGAVNFLTKGEDKGFFIMIEGGKIDWSCHANDAATAFHEVIDMDQAVKVAYEFYKKHPHETLIVVTADHETGGMGLGRGPYEMHLKTLSHQKVSQGALSGKIRELRKARSGKVSWEEIKALLKENMGFWDAVKLSDEQEKLLKEEYKHSFGGGDVELEKSEYARDEPLAGVAKRIINEIALVGWISGGHSDAYVPVFAIGAGAELFQGRYDNTDIPKKIAKAGGY